MKIEDQVFAPPVAANGMMYILTNAGHLVAYGDPSLERKANPSQPETKHVAKPDKGELPKLKRNPSGTFPAGFRSSDLSMSWPAPSRPSRLNDRVFGRCGCAAAG